MRNLKTLMGLLIAISFSTTAIDTPKSFTTAVKRMYNQVDGNAGKTFYCGCDYDAKILDRDSCGYVPKKHLSDSGNYNRRTLVSEVDHVVSTERFGSGLVCYGDKRDTLLECRTTKGNLVSGRQCCLKTNADFRTAHNDLVNLVPSIGEINMYKSSKSFGIIPGEDREFGDCAVELNKEVMEPAEHIRGDIARIHMYMIEQYGVKLPLFYDEDFWAMLERWAEMDPVDDAERERNQKICLVQSFGNKLVGECDGK